MMLSVSPTVIRKGMPTTFDTAEKAISVVNKSIERLGVKKIDFYHIWCIRKSEHYELAMQPGGQYDGLLQCQKEGLNKRDGSFATHIANFRFYKQCFLQNNIYRNIPGIICKA